MRTPSENVTSLQKQINNLQIENLALRQLLEENQIEYADRIERLHNPQAPNAHDANQGGRIIHPPQITEDMAVQFYTYFWGRQDVYSKRFERKNGEAGYFTQCYNFWKDNCPKKQRKKIACKDCPTQAYKKLKKEDILLHLQGHSPTASDVVGVFPLLPNGTCRFLVFDFDNHEKAVEKPNHAPTDKEWKSEVEAMRTICLLNGIDPLVERSRSGRGAHLWIFFNKPIPAELARKFGFSLLEKGAEQVNLKSFKYYDRLLPAQDSLPQGGLGNLIALPLQGKALKEGNSAFVDASWNAYPHQWEALLSKPRLSPEFLEEKIREWTYAADQAPSDNSSAGHIPSSQNKERGKPWKKPQLFSPEDIEGALSLTLSDGIYVDTLNLKPRLQNQLRKMAALRNPQFYKNKAIGTSNYHTPSWLYLGEDQEDGYLKLPRGLLDQIKNLSAQSKITYFIQDERQKGKSLRIAFNGELRKEQISALRAMLKYDNGILHAATAFGKTVVCSALIAERKTNTLIILEASTLIEQWYSALNDFLIIDEELPTYFTKSGQTRTRKNLIGKLQGSHDSTTGIIDIVMAGSLSRKEANHPLFNTYGMVIIDECHHAASHTITTILKNTTAQYVYGVTATPKRTDGLEGINFLMIGPIRHSFSSKEKALTQGFDHLVLPRFTKTVLVFGGVSKKLHPNEAYEIIRNNEIRDAQIVKDVMHCVSKGRTPLVLSGFKDHAIKLFEKLKEAAHNVFLMTGNNSAREHKALLERLKGVPVEESLILVATGKLVGEGFDYPRLDTLIMATPVSSQTVVDQYAGRLNRDFPGKQNVIVYDYVDGHVPFFSRMYAKRLRAYREIGYELCTSTEVQSPLKESPNQENLTHKIPAHNTIFEGKEYAEVFEHDLESAQSNIIISSPALNKTKITKFLSSVSEAQLRGVKVSVLTWKPYAYGYGEEVHWNSLHKQLQDSGINLLLQENYCSQFALIDQEIIWYGCVNLLATEKEEDNIMRLLDKNLVADLLEVVFGNRPEESKESNRNEADFQAK